MSAAAFDRLWDELAPVGLEPSTGGYRRFAWTPADMALREWFAGAAATAGMQVDVDRAGNQWAWWGDPDAGSPGLVLGSHLDSVPDGGAFDGPLGVVSALLAVSELRARGFAPSVPIGIVNFADEEGARFGVACAGSRIITGALTPERTLALRDADGTPMAEAMRSVGLDPAHVGRDEDALRRVGRFVELHVEQGLGLDVLDAPIGVASGIWPHGRWRMEFTGEANHAGTTRLEDRHDPVLAYAATVLRARELAERHGVLATCGKVRFEPNGVNAIASRVTGWLDARGADGWSVRAMVTELVDRSEVPITLSEESWTDETRFDTALSNQLVNALGGAPKLATGAGHDAGILASAGIPTAMLFVRNPTGVSHSPVEFAERDDCLAGVSALADVVEALAT